MGWVVAIHSSPRQNGGFVMRLLNNTDKTIMIADVSDTKVVLAASTYTDVIDTDSLNHSYVAGDIHRLLIGSYVSGYSGNNGHWSQLPAPSGYSGYSGLISVVSWIDLAEGIDASDLQAVLDSISAFSATAASGFSGKSGATGVSGYTGVSGVSGARPTGVTEDFSGLSGTLHVTNGVITSITY